MAKIRKTLLRCRAAGVLIGGEDPERKGVDRALQLLGQGRIDQPLAGHTAQSAKRLGNHCHGKWLSPPSREPE